MFLEPVAAVDGRRECGGPGWPRVGGVHMSRTITSRDRSYLHVYTYIQYACHCISLLAWLERRTSTAAHHRLRSPRPRRATCGGESGTEPQCDRVYRRVKLIFVYTCYNACMPNVQLQLSSVSHQQLKLNRTQNVRSF